MSETVFLNGNWVPYEQAVVPVEDRGYLFSDAIYEVIRCYGGRPFRFDEHIRRLFNSAGALNIPVPYTLEEWRRIGADLLARNNLADATLYFQVSRGAAPRNHLPAEGMTPNVVGIARPVSGPARELVEQGVACMTVPDNRWGLCQIKTTGLLPNVLARQEAQSYGFYDAIFVRDGLVTEATSSNVFAVMDGTVYTHPLANILPGVTRDVVIELVREMGLTLREEAVSLSRLRRADEIWLTSTVIEVLPVTSLDGRPVGDGRPGPVYRRVWEAFQAVTKGG
ncbi:MAG TPA: D-amino-acid transaminase [Sphingobacteriaceae bacterium]|nr:D-amino-acid transaminase [Sphingobacteriaceae bacterium]